MLNKKINIGIDATSIVDGGGFTHLYEFIDNYNEERHQASHNLIIYASKKVLNGLPNHPKFLKRNFSFLNKTRVHRIFFQIFLFDKYLKSECDIVFSLTGDYIGSFRPYVGMSQNMMLYEREFWREIRNIKERGKFYFNFKRQQKCFKNSEGIIFLSKYAKEYITGSLNIKHKDLSIIHHGISQRFISKKIRLKSIDKYSFSNPFRFLYVSTVHVYKNQWNVIESISKLRDKGYPVTLTLIGDIIYKPSGKRLKKASHKFDPDNKFINHILRVPHNEIVDQYFNHDGVIFASTCENMPNILLESMGSGKPIACSNKDPMPEFLKEGGFYFNANSSSSIFEALEKLLTSLNEIKEVSLNNINELKNYTWQNTSYKTIKFLETTFIKYHNLEK